MINPDHLKALRYLTDKTGCTRPYLAGVRVEVKGNRLVMLATCGTLAGMCIGTTAAEDMPIEAFTIPNDTVDQILKATKGNPIAVKSGPDGHLVAAGVFFKPLDGAYPDVRRILPENPTGETAQFDVDLLSRFAKAAKALGSKAGVFHLEHNGGGTAIVRVNGRIDFIGAVMPYRFKELTLVPVAGFKQP